MTESSPAALISRDDDIKAGSAGVLVPSTELKIVNNDNGKECKHLEVCHVMQYMFLV